MAVERIFDEPDVSELLKMNSAPPFGARNAALILGGAYWGLTPMELCLVTTEDVIAPNGELYRIWVLPKHAAFNGEAREVRTEDHVVPFFERYIKMRVERNWSVMANLNLHGSLKPESAFFLNDRGDPYRPTERKDKLGFYQPRSMVDQLKRMISKTSLYGATPASYRDSQIKGLFDNGADWSELMLTSGIKQKRTLESKVRPHERQITSVMSKIFAKVVMPETLT